MGRYPSFFGCNKSQRFLSAFLLFIVWFSQMTFLEFIIPEMAEAAVVTVDAAVSTAATEHLFAGTQTVFTSDQTGYKFYTDSTGTCVYSKTVNGGGSWGAAVTIDSQTDCYSVSIWYDKWTPGDSGNTIHIATSDPGNDDIWYNALDTTTDTRLLGATPVSASANSGQVPLFAAGTNNQTITKGTDGIIYMAASDASDSFVVSCASSCGTGANWNETGTSIMTTGNDWNILMPNMGGGVIVINRQITTDDIRVQTWNGSSWAGGWTTIDASAVESATYDPGMAATIDIDTGDIYLAYATDNDSYTVLDHDIRTAKYTGGSWVNTSDVFTNSPDGLNSVAISRDINIGTVYVAYTLRTTPATATTANVYYATSTAAMTSWGSEQGPVNTTPGDLYAVDLNPQSDERIYATWEDPSPDDIFGNTIADIAPATKLTAIGAQTASLNANVTNQYIGGKFLLKESQTTRNVTNIVLTESGTVAADTAIANVKILYDLDTSAPYDCVSESYAGTESQFGSTDTNGFSGTDGVSSFSSSVSISPTQALCIYPVMDITDDALDGSTLKISVDNPSTDVIVTGGVTVIPATAVAMTASSTIRNDKLTQTHFHWRNDNGNETAATSATGGVADTALNALLINTPKRLRVQVSNEGSIAAPASQYRLEYATAAPTCDVASGWTDVNSANDDWNMYNSTFFTNGANTTNISVANGGVVDENTTFLTPNASLLDTTSQTGSLTLSATNFLEMEFSVVASTTATEGATYCFRVTTSGNPLPVYSVYPSVTISADVTLSATSTQVSSLNIPTTSGYVGGKFVLKENSSSRTVTDITIAENGTVDASANLSSIKLFYDLDTSAPYNCASESYAGTELQFGSTDTDGFSGPDGTSTFSGSVGISLTQTLCIYPVMDISSAALNGDTVQIEIPNGGNDIVLSSGSISPTTPVLLSGTTTLAGAVRAQTGYHWRNDNGSESGATSATGGTENTVLDNHSASSSIRLRVAVSNEGSVTSASTQYRLEYGTKVTACSAVSAWTGVGDVTDGWDIKNSSNLTDGANTTNILVASGGITDPNTTFLTPNAGVKDTSGTTTGITLTNTEFVELEYSITSTGVTGYDTSYCFRVTNGGTPLVQYDQYPEIRTAPKRDFKVQTGSQFVTSVDTVLVAGVDYTAPNSTSSAFVRITNTQLTGAGNNGAGASQNSINITAYISDASDLTSSFTISRPTGATSNTYVAWEIVEFVGEAGTDNEMVVRDAGTVSMTGTGLTVSGSAVSGISDNTDVVVYITGQTNDANNRNTYYAGQSTANFATSTNQPTFERGAGGVLTQISYAVVEYTGINWQIQRVEHNFISSAAIETESITSVNSLAHTFIHAQKRVGAQGNVNNYGHEVWLSSIGAVSFKLEDAATIPAGHHSVVWVIENQQTSNGAMRVQRSNGNTTGGTTPLYLSIAIPIPVDTLNNTSIWTTSRAVGANTAFPRSNAGMMVTSTSTFSLFRSNTGSLLTYYAEIVEWPVSGLAVRQNYYRIYNDNDALVPDDPWPPGPDDIGENTSISTLDEPLGEGDVVRLRMSVKVANANLPSALYQFKLQYGLRVTSCAAVGSWTDVGATASGEVWRGYDAPGVTNGADLSTDPATGGDLLLSVSDVAGSYVETNSAPLNPFGANPGDDVEYDWQLQHNGALERSVYCFRMVHDDGSALDGYFNYPQIRTAGFTPVIQLWRWYDDAENETQLTPLSGESVAPIEIQNDNVLALRVTLGEAKHVQGNDIKFKVQYDEDPNFTSPHDLVSTSTCQATSTWCYADAGTLDNTVISTKTLSDADSCTLGVGNGCGTHNTSATYVTGDIHYAAAQREYVFYLKNAAARAGAVYYFRMYDTLNDLPVDTKLGYSYPSLVAETPKLTLNISGLPASTTVAGETTDVTSTPDTISFGFIPLDTDWHAAHRLSVTTNATEGYRVLSYARQQLLNSYGTAIASVTGTNIAPTSWATGCIPAADGCIGYHTTDATLSEGSTRFSPLDSFAGLETTPTEVMYSSIPSSEVHDILYKVKVGPLQPAGVYETEIVYLAIPTF